MGNLFAIISGIKAVASIIKTVSDLYNKYQDSQIDKHYNAKMKRRGRLLDQMQVESEKEKPSDEVLKDLHRRLYNINSGKL